jgi:hypothetical protein
LVALLSQLGLTPTAKDRAKPTRSTDEEKVDDFARLFVMPGQTNEFVPPAMSAEDLAKMAALDAEEPEEFQEEDRPDSDE